MTNNDVLKKLRIALKLKDTDILDTETIGFRDKQNRAERLL